MATLARIRDITGGVPLPTVHILYPVRSVPIHLLAHDTFVEWSMWRGVAHAYVTGIKCHGRGDLATHPGHHGEQAIANRAGSMLREKRRRPLVGTCHS